MMMDTQNQGRVSLVNVNAELQTRSHGCKPFQVLMADPDVSFSRLYRGPLARQGLEVVTAFSGLECIDRLRGFPPDLLLLEPQLPWGGGDGILAMMGEASWLASVPVMILTSCQDPQLMNRVSRFPISGYRLKPLAPHRLAKSIRALLEHPKQHFTLAEQTGRLENSIERRTGGRVRNLRVETVEGRLIVRRRSDSHDVKQLALAAVQEAFAASESQSDRIGH